jgi:SAM-dependent methyltransferase
VFKYYTWAAAEKTLSYVPGGRLMYRKLSDISNAGDRSKRRLQGLPTSYRLVRKARELVPPGGTILDVGTGWHHHIGFMLHLCGEYEIVLFDIEDKATIDYIKIFLHYLIDNVDEVATELGLTTEHIRQKVEPLLLLPDRESIYRACNFTLCITDKTNEAFLPAATIDFMVSNCVLSHIPPAVLEPELAALRRMLKPGGCMYMMIGHDDHWSFHDLTVNQFNYYRYSDRFYSALFDTKFEYQNRMVRSEWLPIFYRAGLEVKDYFGYITDESRRDIRRLPKIDERFSRYSLEELATVHSYFLLQRH